MAELSNLGGALRPDQQRYAHMMGGIVSPLWVPFMAAASVGAAWWVVQNWPRMVGGANAATRSNGGSAATSGAGSPAGAQAPQGASAGKDLPSAARSFSQDVAAPVTESLAVQGANDSEAAAGTQAPAPKPAPKKAKAAPPQRAAAAPQEKSPAPRKAQATAPKAKVSGQDPAVAKLLAAASAHPEPELPPHEGLPARKKGGGKAKKNGA